jgi:hypothetical protein
MEHVREGKVAGVLLALVLALHASRLMSHEEGAPPQRMMVKSMREACCPCCRGYARIPRGHGRLPQTWQITWASVGCSSTSAASGFWLASGGPGEADRPGHGAFGVYGMQRPPSPAQDDALSCHHVVFASLSSTLPHGVRPPDFGCGAPLDGVGFVPRCLCAAAQLLSSRYGRRPRSLRRAG